jgi:cation diffusion facilitator family transporter
MATAADLADLSHDHVFLGTSHDRNARRTLWVVALTATMMVGEIVAGYLTGSMALLADGFHMATHAGALSVAAAAYAYAKRHATNPRFSFGTGKVGDLAGFASALVLGLIALAIGVESVMRLFRPITVAFGTATWIACIGLAVNVASAFLLAAAIIPTVKAMITTTIMAGRRTTICVRPTSTSSRTR